jgi:hypothetical protein
MRAVLLDRADRLQDDGIVRCQLGNVISPEFLPSHFAGVR